MRFFVMKGHDFYIEQAIQDLTSCGYQILEVDLPNTSYPPAQLITNTQNKDTFLPDIVCEKAGKRYIVEVKTGYGGIVYDDTFAQLKKMDTYSKQNNFGFLLYIDWEVYQSWILTEGQLQKKGIDNFVLFHSYFEREPYARFVWYVRSNHLNSSLTNLKMNVYGETKPDKITYKGTNCGFTPDMTYTLAEQDYLCVCMSGFSNHPRVQEKLKFFDNHAKNNNQIFVIYTYQSEKAIQEYVKKENLTAQVFLSDFDVEEGAYADDLD